MKGEDDLARQSLAKLRGQPIDSSYVFEEHAELEESWLREFSAGAGSGSFFSCFAGGLKKGSNLHRTFIGTSVQVMQQLSKFHFFNMYPIRRVVLIVV